MSPVAPNKATSKRRSAEPAKVMRGLLAFPSWWMWAPATAFSGVFEPLRDPAYFAQVTVDPELGTVVWPNGADLDPMVLHAALQGRSVRVA